MRQEDISAASSCSGKLLWRIDERVFLSNFNVQPDIFAVMNCCILALGVYYTDSLTWSANSLYSLFSAMTHRIRRVDVEKYAYYVNTLRRNVGLEIWLWRQLVTSKQRTPNTNTTTCRWMKPSMKIFCVRHCWQLPWFAHASQLINVIEIGRRGEIRGLFYQGLTVTMRFYFKLWLVLVTSDCGITAECGVDKSVNTSACLRILRDKVLVQKRKVWRLRSFLWHKQSKSASRGSARSRFFKNNFYPLRLL